MCSGSAYGQERVTPAPLVWHFTPLVIEKTKQARFGHQREFLKDLVDTFVVSQGRVTVFQWPPVTRGKRRKKGVSSIVAGMVEQMSQCRELTRAFRFVFR